jgi:endonuclease-3
MPAPSFCPNPLPALDALLALLAQTYPDAHCELHHSNPLELLMATILSAQCTDARVNQVTPLLFQRCPSAQHYVDAPLEELEKMIKTTGFYRAKARHLQGCARALVQNHAGKVPDSIEELTALPGVGRKTANVVLGDAFGKPAGIVVDTHVQRLSQRLGLTAETDPIKIESDLTRLVPRAHWARFSHWLIWHGRRRCGARQPDCAHCELRALCPSSARDASRVGRKAIPSPGGTTKKSTPRRKARKTPPAARHSPSTRRSPEP